MSAKALAWVKEISLRYIVLKIYKSKKKIHSYYVIQMLCFYPKASDQGVELKTVLKGFMFLGIFMIQLLKIPRKQDLGYMVCYHYSLQPQIYVVNGPKCYGAKGYHLKGHFRLFQFLLPLDLDVYSKQNLCKLQIS